MSVPGSWREQEAMAREHLPVVNLVPSKGIKAQLERNATLEFVVLRNTSIENEDLPDKKKNGNRTSGSSRDGRASNSMATLTSTPEPFIVRRK
jgi:hypothetical protein